MTRVLKPALDTTISLSRTMAAAFLALPLLLSGPAAWGAIEFLGASGYSNIDTSGANPVIYAGTAGSDASCTSNADGTCNNCPTGANTFTACNPKRVLSNTTLTLNFRSTSATGCPTVTGSVTTDAYFSTTTSVAAGTATSISFTWGELCPKLQSTATSCAENITKKTIRLGISDGCQDSFLDSSSDDSMVVSITVQEDMANDTTCAGDSHCGIYNFQAFRGDKKVYFLNSGLTAGTSFPNSSTGIKYKSVLVFYYAGTNTFASDGFNNINVNGLSGGYAKFDIGENSSQFYIAPDSISGLTNDIYYYFRMAVQDVAGNVGYFTTDLDTQDVHAVAPSEVVGLLAEDLNCFIATAAYGSPFAEQVQTFRDFRDRYLKTSHWGRAFISWYYQHAPNAARWISRNQILRVISQALLVPFWFFAKVSLVSSLSLALLIGLLGLTGTGWFIRRYLRRRHQRRAPYEG